MVEQMAGTSLYERAEHAARIIRARTTVEPRIAVVLGSGLGGFADDFEDPVGIPYEEIPGFARSTVQGHAGRLVIGKVDGTPVVRDAGPRALLRRSFTGRRHVPDQNLWFTRHQNPGAHQCCGRNKCPVDTGSVDGYQRSPEPDGSQSAWVGPNDERFGPRFPDMTAV